MRGQTASVGATRVAANGYHYTKTKTGWRLTHHIIAEKKFNRHIDRDVTVRFKDNDRTNLDEDNIDIRPKADSTKGKRRQILQQRIRELKAELDALE